MRDSGLLLRQIAEATGLAISTVQDLLVDPSGEKARERKRRYERACVGCGKTINPNGLRVETVRCHPCEGEHRREMTRRWILDSFAQWHDLFGAPPSTDDWSPARVRHRGWKGSVWRIRRYESTGRPWPPVCTVQEHFGTWTAALRAAGFEPLSPSEYWLGHAGKALKLADQRRAA